MKMFQYVNIYRDLVCYLVCSFRMDGGGGGEETERNKYAASNIVQCDVYWISC